MLATVFLFLIVLLARAATTIGATRIETAAAFVGRSRQDARNRRPVRWPACLGGRRSLLQACANVLGWCGAGRMKPPRGTAPPSSGYPSAAILKLMLPLA